MFILPVSGTIALRNILISILIFALIINFFKEKYFLDILKPNKDLLIILFALLVFLLYAFFHSMYLSEVPEWSLKNFREHLFYASIYFIVGILLANFIHKSKIVSARTIVTILFFSMFLHILYIDLVALDRLWNSGEILRRYGGFIKHVTAANYITNILLAMSISELVYRLRVKRRILLISDGILYLLLVFCIISTYIEGLRLGDISLVFLGVGSAVVFLYKNNEFSKQKRRLIATSLIVILSTPLAYNITMDPRWSKLIETVPLAINSANSKHWVDHSAQMPITESGYAVGGSNYVRIFRAKKSVDFIMNDPFGIGYGGDSFGRAFKKIYPEYGKEYYHGRDSHSAILSLTIGIGIPGLMLWLVFVYTVVKVSINNFKESYNYFSIMTLFIIMGMFSRSFVDTNMRDHVFLQYMIILGISLFFMIKGKSSAHIR